MANSRTIMMQNTVHICKAGETESVALVSMQIARNSPQANTFPPSAGIIKQTQKQISCNIETITKQYKYNYRSIIM